MRVVEGRTVVALANNRKAILAMVSLKEAASKESELQLINQLEV